MLNPNRTKTDNPGIICLRITEVGIHPLKGIKSTSLGIMIREERSHEGRICLEREAGVGV
jgi:hypothetical protein